MPKIPPKRKIAGDIKFPKPSDVQEKYYGRADLNPKNIEKRYAKYQEKS